MKHIKIEYHDTLPSTNTYLKEKAHTEDEGFVVIANSQTAGRGRFDRKYYSPKNSGIYMSILLKPRFSGFDATLITTAAAVAVANVCESLSGKQTQIKWVNDVLIDGKKICGILTEGSINPKNGNVEYVILGIGVNAFAPENGFEDEIKDIAGFVFDNYDFKLKERLINEIINIFFSYYKNLSNKEYLDEYRNKSLVLGKEITVIKGEEKILATAISIDEDCRLQVKFPDKTTKFLSSGEISIKI